MSELPLLYTLKEVAAAMKCSLDTVRRALNRHPFIRPIGRGRGTRLTLDDYNALIEAMRGPGPGYIRPQDGSMPHPGDKNAMRAYRTRQTRAMLKPICERWKREELQGKK